MWIKEEKRQKEMKLLMRKYVCLVHFENSDKVFKTFVYSETKKDAMDIAYRRSKEIHSHNEWTKLGRKRIEAVMVEPDAGA